MLLYAIISNLFKTVFFPLCFTVDGGFFAVCIFINYKTHHTWYICLTAVFLKGICQETTATHCHESDPEELCCLPQTQELAVVEALHKGQPIILHRKATKPLVANSLPVPSLKMWCCVSSCTTGQASAASDPTGGGDGSEGGGAAESQRSCS